MKSNLKKGFPYFVYLILGYSLGVTASVMAFVEDYWFIEWDDYVYTQLPEWTYATQLVLANLVISNVVFGFFGILIALWLSLPPFLRKLNKKRKGVASNEKKNNN